MDIKSLNTDGYVTVQYPNGLRLRVQEAMAAWVRFCELSESEKRKISGGDRIDDYGYMRRNDSGPRADNKEQFHLLKLREPELLAQALTVSDTRAVEFVRAADVLSHAIKPIIVEFVERMEREYEMPGFSDEVLGSTDLWTFRFLHYFGGDMLANSHADRLGFTLHLYENDGGGEYLGFDMQWKTWPVDHEQTIIFPSIGLQHRSGGKVKALWHKVEPNERTKVNGRYAMVAFIDFPQAREWDKYKYPHVKELTPGFNYKMSFADLDAHFTQVVA